MPGYTPVFETMLEGTLYGKWPHTGVWACLLSMTDQKGEINKNPRLIATAIGVPLDQLMQCIADFMAPDPESQSREKEGRRLELLDSSRDWGWRVINAGKYREKARLMGKSKREVEGGSNATRLRDRRGPPKTADERPSDIDLNSKSKRGNPRSRKCPPEFVPDLAWAQAEVPEMDVEREAQKFKDWEFKSPKSDWAATWRNWVGTARDGNKFARKQATVRKWD